MHSIAHPYLIPAVAVILDMIFGDPRHLPHPVRLIGAWLDLCERHIRKKRIRLRIAGWITVFLSAAGAWWIVNLLTHIPLFGTFIAVYLAYAGLALGCLLKEARKVVKILESGDLIQAQQALSLLVSRDTSTLGQNGIRQTLAETVSENLNDGFVAPLFYLCLFGPGGLWAYKTISTMDSMWGYRTERFQDLGRGAAKMDDVLAWVPARLTAYLMLLAAQLKRGFDVTKAKANYKHDAKKMESPNAGWPMAAAAWIIGGTMGGPTVYFGKIKDKPILGPVGRKWDAHMINDLLSLCFRTGVIAACVCIPILGWLS